MIVGKFRMKVLIGLSWLEKESSGGELGFGT
jgi:hypothetical protein